jgi:hypothetical protein
MTVPTGVEYSNAQAVVADPSSTEAQKAAAQEVINAYPKPSTARPVTVEPRVTPRMRAKFTVSEVTTTSRGVSVITLSAAHDASAPVGGIGAPQLGALPKAVPAVPNPSNPRGNISLEVGTDYAALLHTGDVFYLVSA